MSISRAKRYSKKRRRSQTNITGSKSKFKRGFYKPVNETYQQPMDRTMNKSIYPEYRSSWELKLMKFLDHNPEVEYWTVEPFPINYLNPKDNQIHRYFVDFMVKFKNGKKILIEVKPEGQKSNPINIAKWEAATQFSKEQGFEFVVMGAKELGIS